MPALTVHNAEVKTATVEIKTLTISGKQVTLAVFRQLQIGDWYRDEEQIGQGWGTVNYHPDGACKRAGEHLDVVWQRGSELRRALAERPRFPRADVGLVGSSDNQLNVLRCPKFHALVDIDEAHNVAHFRDQVAVFGPRLEGTPIRIPLRQWRSWRSEHQCSVRCDAALTNSLAWWSSDALTGLAIWRQWNAASALPQLFIAV